MLEQCMNVGNIDGMRHPHTRKVEGRDPWMI